MRKFFLMVALCLSLAACGGSSTKSSKGDNRSNYEKLESVATDLNKAVDTVMNPLDNFDATIATMEAIPSKYNISQDDYKALVLGSIRGEFVPPADASDEVKGELKQFSTDFGAFYTSIMNAPANTEALIKTVGQSIIDIPVLTTKASAEIAKDLANPLASKSDKAKAQAKKDGLQKLSDDMLHEATAVKDKLADAPAKAAAAPGKLTAALKKAGIDNVEGAQKTATGAADDAKASVKKGK